MQKVDPLVIKEDVANKHFDTLKNLTKDFIDPEHPNYKKCSPFAPYLAWAQQFILYIKNAKAED